MLRSVHFLPASISAVQKKTEKEEPPGAPLWLLLASGLGGVLVFGSLHKCGAFHFATKPLGFPFAEEESPFDSTPNEA